MPDTGVLPEIDPCVDMAVERLADAGIVKGLKMPRNTVIRLKISEGRELRKGIAPAEGLTILRVRQSARRRRRDR